MTSVTELEREIATTRSRLNGTIDQIQDKLTVSGIVDEVMSQAGVPRLDSGHDFLMGVLRRHPVPMMIAAAGLGFLIYQSSKRRAALRSADDLIAVPVMNTGQARVYDPDTSFRHPAIEARDGRRTGDIQA